MAVPRAGWGKAAGVRTILAYRSDTAEGGLQRDSASCEVVAWGDLSDSCQGTKGGAERGILKASESLEGGKKKPKNSCKV